MTGQASGGSCDAAEAGSSAGDTGAPGVECIGGTIHAIVGIITSQTVSRTGLAGPPSGIVAEDTLIASSEGLAVQTVSPTPGACCSVGDCSVGVVACFALGAVAGIVALQAVAQGRTHSASVVASVQVVLVMALQAHC